MRKRFAARPSTHSGARGNLEAMEDLQLGKRIVTGRPAYVVVVLVAVFVGSLLAIALGQGGVQQAGSQALVASLLGLLLQVMLDVNARERSQVEQTIEQAFAIGSASHMANVTFDRQVRFCEAYVAELRSTLETLTIHGPTPLALDHASRLCSIREEHALWLTAEMEDVPKRIEQCLRTHGATGRALAITEPGSDDSRLERVERLFRSFRDLLGKDLLGARPDDEPMDESLAISQVVGELRRGVLGVDDLARLRSSIVRRAATSAEASRGRSSPK